MEEVASRNLELIIQATPHSSSTRVEVETEFRVSGNHSERIRAAYGFDGRAALDIKARDEYFAVNGLMLRIRDHEVNGVPILRANVKVPLAVPAYGEGRSPQVVEFTWDFPPGAYETLKSALTPVTVVEGRRRQVDVEYLAPHGPVSIILAFDTIDSLRSHADFTKISEPVFTEFSEEDRFREIPFGTFSPFLNRMFYDRLGSGEMLEFLSSTQGLTTQSILNRVNRASGDVTGFMSKLGIPESAYIGLTYPELQVQNGNHSPQAGRLYSHE